MGNEMRILPIDKRQYGYYYGYGDPWYYWIRWVVIGGILLIVLLALLISYLHARRRLRKGLRPLAYHAWMIPWRQRAHLYETGYTNGAPPGGYQVPLGTYPYAPPPVYQQGQPYWNQPQQNGYPMYSPPDGAPQKY